MLMVAGPSKAQESFSWYPVFKPQYFYSPSAGFGVGVGVNGENLLRAGDAVRLRTRTQQFRQSLELGWATRSPEPGYRGLMMTASLYRNVREGFYGVGPAAPVADEQNARRVSAEVGLRRSFRAGGGVWVQPRLDVTVDRFLGHEDARPTEGADVFEAYLNGLRARDAFGTLSLGLDLARPVGPVTIQAHGTTRFSGDGLVHVLGGVLADWPVYRSGHRELSVRALLDRSFHVDEDLPYWFLPRLDDRLAPGLDRFRFYARDRLVLGAEYVHPILEILRSHAYEAVLHVGLAQVYDDIGRQVSLRFEAGPDRTAPLGRIPLEPTFGIGSRFVSRQSGKVIASAMLGFSAEGLQATTFRFSQRLSGWNSSVR